MKPSNNLLRHHAYRLLQNTQEQAKQLSDIKNPEALHDFRVSIRHLRSFLKSYQDVLDKDSKKLREQLGELMQTTNTGRDNEVHLAWLNQQQKTASTELKLGIQMTLQTFSDHPPLKVKKLQKQFGKHGKKLTGLFKKIRFDEGFNILTATILTHYSKTLKTELSQLNKDETLLHQTRITGKRLRYTLELLDSKESKKLVGELKTLQDILGETNDLRLLLQKVERLLVARAIQWPQSFIAASKNLDINEKMLPELEQAFVLAVLKKHILTTLQKNQHQLKTSWLGRSNNTFFKELNSYIKVLSKTPDPALLDA